MGYRRVFRLTTDHRDVEREMDEEVEANVALRAEALERRGMTPEEALAEARRGLNSRDARARLHASAWLRSRRVRRRAWLASIAQDLRLAMRRARAAPTYTLLVLVIFAAGIGLATTAWSVVDHVLLRALPFPESERLVALQTADSTGAPVEKVAAQTWLDWQEHDRWFGASALYRSESWAYASDAGAVNVDVAMVTDEFFAVLGTPLLAGRVFEVQGEVVVSESFWRSALGAPHDFPVQITLSGATMHVVGIVDEGAVYPVATQVYYALSPSRWANPQSYNAIGYHAIARLADGVTAEQTTRALGELTTRIGAANVGAVYLHGARAVPLKDVVVADAARYIRLLMGAVLVLLLISCFNVAALGTARTVARSDELAVRSALGAGRRRLVRQLLTEHLLLATLGGAAGIGVAWLATRVLVSSAAAYLPRAGEISLDARVLAFTVIASLTAGVLAGLAPAVRGGRLSLSTALVGVRGGVAGGRGLAGAPLLVLQVALSVTLLTGGGLLMRSMQTLLQRDLGFHQAGLVTAEASFFNVYPATRFPAEWQRLEARLAALPGVTAVGMANWIPTGTAGAGFIRIEGRDGASPAAGFRIISDGYLNALGVRRLAGRGLDSRDRIDTEPTTLINRAMAEQFWQGEDPLGRRVQAFSMEGSTNSNIQAPWRTVVGVVENLRHGGHESEPEPEMYVSLRQVHESRLGTMTTVLQAEPDGFSAISWLPPVRRAFHSVHPGVPVEVNTIDRRLRELLAERRLLLGVLSGIAGISLVLAATGVFALLSFSAARRRREIGVRSAIGASRGDILRMMLHDGLRVVMPGLLLGLVGALWTSRLLQAMLVDMAPHDPVSFTAATVILLFTTLAAALLPAWRAASVAPVEAMR